MAIASDAPPTPVIVPDNGHEISKCPLSEKLVPLPFEITINLLSHLTDPDALTVIVPPPLMFTFALSDSDKVTELVEIFPVVPFMV